MIYHIGLGSNLGDGPANLALARRLLGREGVRILKASSLYHTEPVDLREQPWFVNQVLEVRSGLDPRSLLSLAKSVETAMKRVRTAAKGPRTIDVDILLAGQLVLETPDLTVPHPRLAHRKFVLVPLAEIAPDIVHPVLKKPIRVLAQESGDPSRVEKFAAGTSRPGPGRPEY